MKRRRLRRLVPDEALIRRRAAGEPLREIAPDYEVEHTTLARYFARPEVAKELKEMKRRLLAEERAFADRRAAERRLGQEVRKKAREQAAREKKHERHAAAVVAEQSARRRRPRNEYEAWLDERDSRVPLTRRDLWSTSDEIAAGVVAEGGGIEAVIAATGSHTLENVVRTIDPAIVKQAYDNDLLVGRVALTVVVRVRLPHKGPGLGCDVEGGMGGCPCRQSRGLSPQMPASLFGAHLSSALCASSAASWKRTGLELG